MEFKLHALAVAYLFRIIHKLYIIFRIPNSPQISAKSNLDSLTQFRDKETDGKLAATSENPKKSSLIGPHRWFRSYNFSTFFSRDTLNRRDFSFTVAFLFSKQPSQWKRISRHRLFSPLLGCIRWRNMHLVIPEAFFHMYSLGITE